MRVSLDHALIRYAWRGYRINNFLDFINLCKR